VSFRDIAEIEYEIKRTGPFNLTMISGVVSDFFKDEKVDPIKFRYKTYLVFVPADIFSKIHGWLKLPVEKFEEFHLEGKLWKSIRKKAVVYNPFKDVADVFFDGIKAEKYDFKNKAKIIKRAMDGEKIRDIAGSIQPDTIESLRQDFERAAREEEEEKAKK